MASSPAFGHRPHSWTTFNPPFGTMQGVYGLQTSASGPLNRHRIDSINHHGLEGAKQLISMIKKRRCITVLNLPHNDLGAEGCEALLTFLLSSDGEKHLVSEIVLTSNKLGNKGLEHIIKYLHNNVHLKKLMVQNNQFERDTDLFGRLVQAVNSSALEVLYMGTNHGLSDTFAQTFLPQLNAPSLRELNMSTSRISTESLPVIVEYVSSPERCRLHTFGCSANSLGTAGVRKIIEAVEKTNYRVKKLDLFSNQNGNETVDNVENRDEWRHTYNQLTKVLARNAQCTRETEKQALRLLRYSRPTLLHHIISTSGQSSNVMSCGSECSCMTTPSTTLPSSSSNSVLDLSPAPRLPVELKQHILSFISPILSPTQRIRIFHYASSPMTLPSLLPSLNKAHTPQRADPTGLGFGSAGGSCSPGKCMGSHNSLHCHRAEDRTQWMELVGCDAYDPPPPVVQDPDE